ncbi:MAG: prepilin-type N-terminal cleavage/methylation domain-containing protein [Bacillota bacterium]|nr:prepilin-type N-terminal cleavage/methylation domain-containing protein [Bacillota bacterium]
MIKAFRKRMKNQKGFTLVELLVVFVILGILAMVAIPSVVGITERSKERADEATASAIANAVKYYYANEGNWPATGEIDDDHALIPEYLDEAPISQSTGRSFTINITDGEVLVSITPAP